MTRVTEKLDIMEAITSKFTKQKTISISRLIIVLVLVLFILGVIATGLLTYHFTPKVQHVIETHCNSTEKYAGRIEEISDTSVVTEIEETTEELTTYPTTEVLVEDKQMTNKSRLPKSIVPISYEIFLLPFIFEGNFTFSGNVSIVVNVTEPTDTITLHADQLDIDHGSVEVLKNSTSIEIEQISNDTKRNFFTIKTMGDLDPGGLYLIKISFVGVLNDLLEGFYRSSYKANNTKRWVAATQFQATYARKAFPCFDEPALKATFQVNIGRSQNMSSVSNMPRVNTSPVENMDGYIWDIYKPSVPMSSYLVAFVVSDFEYASNGTVSVWFRKGAKNQSAFSLKVGPALLKFFEDYFQIAFPLPKIDMVALPDFSNGAMENWGLITYRESMLLFEPGVSTKPNLQAILIVIAHELAHQWFGNLVTPVWWTDLWLNEGFASYMEFLAADAVSPELKILDQYVHELQGVLSLDALKSSHQISIEVYDPDEINDIFDRISYVKGSAIIRMMEQFLTSPVFRRGLNTYLKERAYSNAEQDDLWMSLTNQAHKDGVLAQNVTVKQIMDTWTLQTGYPVITVTREFQNSVKFNQDRFLISGKSTDPSPLWWVPITYVTKGDRTLKKAWLEKEEEIELEIKTPASDWILVNVNQTGYYRVNYDPRNWKLLIDQLNSKKGYEVFDPKNRAQLLDDSFNLASAGYIDYDIPLNVSRYLVSETELVPWKSAFNTFDYLYNVFSRSAHFDKFKKYFLHLLQNLYKDIGFHEKPKDSTLTIYTRMELLARSCLFGSRSCIMNAILEFQNWRNSPDPDRSNPISANLRSIVYCYAIKSGGQEEWDFAWERYQKAHVGSEKELIMSALGCSKEPWLLRRYLEWAVTPGSGIRKQDAFRVFAAVSNTIIGQHITYTFLKSNWKQIKAYMGSSLSILIGIIRESITLYPIDEELSDIKIFTSELKKEFTFAARTINQLIEQGEANLKWRNSNFDYIVDWLKREHMS